MACCPKSNLSTYLVIITIWVELGSGLAATIWTAFFNNLIVDVFAYLIFGVNVTFAAGLIFYTIFEIQSRLNQNNKKTTTIIWVFVGCTLVSFGLFYTLAFYNLRVIGQPKNGIKVIQQAFGVFFIAVAVLVLLSTFSLFHTNQTQE